jgi:hypothetical protein
MKRKWMLIISTVVVFGLCIAGMTGAKWLKKPFGEDDQLFQSVKQLEQHVQGKQWSAAKERSEYAEKAWEKVVNRIQFSTEREYMYDISGTLSRIKGGVVAEDDQAVLEEIYFFYGLWDNLGG